MPSIEISGYYVANEKIETSFLNPFFVKADIFKVNLVRRDVFFFLEN